MAAISGMVSSSSLLSTSLKTLSFSSNGASSIDLPRYFTTLNGKALSFTPASA